MTDLQKLVLGAAIAAALFIVVPLLAKLATKVSPGVRGALVKTAKFLALPFLMLIMFGGLGKLFIGEFLLGGLVLLIVFGGFGVLIWLGPFQYRLSPFYLSRLWQERLAAQRASRRARLGMPAQNESPQRVPNIPRKS